MTLWFVVPAHGRFELTRICLRQLRRTCDVLTENGLDATAVVIADDDNLDTARDLGFGTVGRDNRFVSRRFNDGIQLACDPAYNPRPADYVVPCGSDDWVHPDLILRHLPPDTNSLVGFQQVAFVREDGREMSYRTLQNIGGAGIRIYPRQVMATLDYRPADEDRYRGCDTSTLTNLMRNDETIRVFHGALDPREIVDWKSPDEQLNSYAMVARRHKAAGIADPFDMLAGWYPDEALAEMQEHYERQAVAA